MDDTTCEVFDNKDINITCVVDSGETMRFWLDKVTTEKVKIGFGNFHLPWSVQHMDQNELRYYENKECMGKRSRVLLPALRLKPATMPVQVSSSSKVLGDLDSTLSISFSSPNRRGLILISTPPWYN